MHIRNKFTQAVFVLPLLCSLQTGMASDTKLEKSQLTQRDYGLTLGGTRVIYNEGSSSISFWIKNKKEYPILVQSQVFNEDKESKAPFIVTPPLLRMDSNIRTRLKIISTSKSFKENVESLYWFCVKGIPPKNDDLDDEKKIKSTSLNINIITNSCIKLIYRPKNIEHSITETIDKLSLSRQGSHIVIKNQSPSYVNISNIKSGSQNINIPNGYIKPFGDTELLGKIQSPLKITFLDDYGAEITKEFIIKE